MASRQLHRQVSRQLRLMASRQHRRQQELPSGEGGTCLIYPSVPAGGWRAELFACGAHSRTHARNLVPLWLTYLDDYDYFP